MLRAVRSAPSQDVDGRRVKDAYGRSSWVGRVTWDEYFKRFAEIARSRSTCLRAQHGAVIVRDNHIVATGYNGAPRGLAHCVDAGCTVSADGIRCERSLHAEENALIQAARDGLSTTGATIYVTGFPCEADARRIIQAGITRVVYYEEYATMGAEVRKEMENWYRIAGVGVDKQSPPVL